MSNSDNHVTSGSTDKEKKYLFDNPKNVRNLMRGFYVCCVVLVIMDFVVKRYLYHPWEGLWAFYPIYGFVGCVILVVVAKWMRTFLMRPEGYYEQDKEPLPASADKPESAENSHV